MRTKGFSLLVVSAIIAIAAIAVITIISIVPAKHAITQKQDTLQQMQIIDMALQEFVSKNGRLPCPASPADTASSSQYGLEQRVNYTCDSTKMTYSATNSYFIGIIPFKTLGLEGNRLGDGWNNKIEYAVSNNMYRNSYEDITNNFRTAVETLKVQTGTDNIAAAYVIISRGDATGGIPIANTKRSNVEQLSSAAQKQRFKCTDSQAMCDSDETTATYIRDQDIILAHSKAELMKLCAVKSTHNNCTSKPCVNFAHAIKWRDSLLANVDETLTLQINATSPLPSLLLKAVLAPYNQFSLNFTVKSLNIPNGTISLLYDYKLPNSETTHTTTLAKFGNSSDYAASYIGKTITIDFGGIDHIPQKLYFTRQDIQQSQTAVLDLSDINLVNKLFNQQSYLLQQRWDNVTQATNSVFDLFTNAKYPNAPSNITLVNSFSGPKNYGSAYGIRIYGYITPVVSGGYTFYIASSDPSALFLSTDSSEGNKLEIAYVPGSTGLNIWNKFPTQTSNAILMQAGKSYFIEGVFKSNGTTPDHFEVAWTTPNGQLQNVISGAELSTSPVLSN